ncbi:MULTISPECIES: hypothetical protein [Haloferacaceae]|uniref:Uncharacterized protein n=1 Tax=Halorubrum glutamatedens TaxID=2707018 RepID=A0ABD5QWN1_9EURY|nr:hypothetical protein [Halobellus captivus]
MARRTGEDETIRQDAAGHGGRTVDAGAPAGRVDGAEPFDRVGSFDREKPTSIANGGGT